MPIEWKVSLSDLDWGQEETAAVTRVLASKWITMGSVTQSFEQAFACYLGVKYAFAVTNGTAALHIAHLVAGVAPGDEVICPSLTFVATANAIVYAGATPIFADISGLDDLNISAEDVERRITPRTKTITVMHYGGYPCDMERIMEIADCHRLSVIEDAAHAPGAEYNGKKLGAIGDVGCFSFFSNKNLAVGEGGLIVTNREDWAERIRLFRSHGMTTLTWDRHKGHAHTYDVVELGYNYRLDEIRAAIGLVQLDKLEKNNQRRAEIAQAYRQCLAGTPGLTIPFGSSTGCSSHHIFPILLDKGISRSELIQKMKEFGVQTSIHYPPVHLFSYYRQRYGYSEGALPIAEQVASRELTLPLHPLMRDADVDYVIRCVKDALQGGILTGKGRTGWSFE